MKRSKILDRIRKARAKYIDIFVDNSFDLSGRIQYLLDKKGMEQKDLARELKKNESEISKWLSGSHNFTLKTLAKIEDVLGEKLFEVISDDIADNRDIKVIILNQEDIYQPHYSQIGMGGSLKSYSPTYKKANVALC